MYPVTLDALMQQHFHFESITSTNDFLIDYLKNRRGEIVVGEPICCTADVQTKGRGRHDKTWHAYPGQHIALSMLWRFEHLPASFSTISLVAGIALIRAFEALGIDQIQLKWPNDCYYQQRFKCAGILVEVFNHDIIIGIGVNVDAVNDSDNKVIGLQQIAKQTLDYFALRQAIIQQLTSALKMFSQCGFAHFQHAWQQYDMLKGMHVKLACRDAVLQGVAQGVNEQGALLVLTEQGNMHSLYDAQNLSWESAKTHKI